MLRRFRPYFRYLRPLRLQLWLSIICMGVYSAASGFGLPFLIPHVFGPVFGRDRSLPLGQIALLTLTVPAIFLVRGLAGYASSYLFQLIGTRVLEAIRLEYFRKLQELPLSFLQKHSSGELASRALADAQQVQTALTLAASDGIKHPLTLAGALTFVVWAAVRAEGVLLAVVCLMLVPLSVFPVRFVARKVLKRAHQAQAQLGSISAQLNENLSAAREVRAFGAESRAIARFAATCRELLTAQLKIAKYSLGLNPVIEILSAIGIAVTLIYAYRAGLKFEVLMGVLVALYQCYEPIKKLGALNSELKRGSAALDRIEYVLHEPVGITDPASPTPVARLSGEIAFSGVTFAYGATPALRDVTATIPRGTVCALVGPSGAGKSTFANLVPRFYEVGQGGVTLDGIDVRAMRLADLRRNIALVSQEPVLFNDTIYNNLALGKAGATRDEIMAAARSAHADEFIRTLPQGYDTMVGERGALLSGGQKQRIAIARAFLRNAPILILDEATSALDSESEAAVQDALRKLVVGKTVLIIAHRFSTIRDASMILVFDKGEIVAQGTHASLYAGNALYKSLYDRQQGNGGT
jgi:subfamily B ATP-binding cassette protein MsbA